MPDTPSDPEATARSRRWLPLGLIGALAILYVLPGFLPHRIFLPIDIVQDYGSWKPHAEDRTRTSNPLLADPLLEYDAWDHVVRERIANAKVPWRNHWAAGGAHLFANPEVTLFSPFIWPRLLLGERGWVWTCFLRLLVAGLGMFWFTKVLGGTSRASLLAGAIYIGSGYSIVWLLYSHANLFAALPWLAGATIQSLRDPSPRKLLTVALTALFATTGGHPETLAQVVVMLALVLVWHGYRERIWSARSAGLTACAALAGLLMLGVQLVPFFIALKQSYLFDARQQPNRQFRLVAVAGELLPGFLGSPLRDEIDLSGAWPNGENFNERSGGFVGLAAFLILLSSARGLAPLHRRMLVIAFVALLISWRTPVLWWLVHHVPLLRTAANERFGGAFVFLSAPIVGIVASQPLRKPKTGSLLVVAGLAGIVTGTFLGTTWGAPVVHRAADWGVSKLIARGYLTKGLAVYQARMITYLAGIRWTAIRRLLFPAVSWMLAGFALLRSRPKLLMAALVLELLSFGFGYNPGVPADNGATALEPPLVIQKLHQLDPSGSAIVAVLGDALPANLATIYLVRDLRSYDVLQRRSYIEHLKSLGYDPVSRQFPERSDPAFVAQLRALGAGFVIGREAPAGGIQRGGLPAPAVGLYELPGRAVAQRLVDDRPEGVGIGAGVSFSGLLLCYLAVAMAARGRNAPRVERIDFAR